jgi:uncharacterized protein
LTTEALNRQTEAGSVRYVAPFVTFLIFLAIDAQLPLDTAIGAPLRVLALALVCWFCWPKELSLRPTQPLQSIAVGALVFLLWIAPDVLFHGYRDSIFFSNPVLGHLHSSLRPEVLKDPWVLAWRSVRAIVIVPVVEELFWRAWLMRWLIDNNFNRVAIGTYTAFSFWITALLFASEHGPYWDVGLLTGIIYNFWLIRTKSVANCILMHAVTNGILSAYVIYTGQWQYWQ